MFDYDRCPLYRTCSEKTCSDRCEIRRAFGDLFERIESLEKTYCDSLRNSNSECEIEIMQSNRWLDTL